MIQVTKLYNGEVTLELDDEEHLYFWVEKGLPVDGVTSILKILDKPAIGPWMVKLAVQHIMDGYTAAAASSDGFLSESAFAALCQEAKTAHKRKIEGAANIGRAVHKFAEDTLKNKRATLPLDASVRNGAQAFLTWVNANKVEPILIERRLLSRRFYYAGTMDLLAHVNGRRAIVDFKTSSGLYLEMLIQLGGYAVAWEEEFGERIDDGWIIRLDKETGECQPYYIPITNDIRDSFLRVREAEDAIDKVKGKLNGLRKTAA